MEGKWGFDSRTQKYWAVNRDGHYKCFDTEDEAAGYSTSYTWS